MNRRVLPVGAVLAGLAAVLVGLTAAGPGLGWYLVAWGLFFAALRLSRALPARSLSVLVLGGGIVMAATGLIGPPSTSTDSYRYAWDGEVQAAGISPYDHPPADPALAGLRESWLFPGDCGVRDRHPLPEGGCSRINRPTVPTIYPPLAEGYFLLVHWLSPEGSRHKVLQLGGFVMAVLVLLIVWRRPWGAVWAWCPAVPIEAVNNAHVDILGVLLVVVAFSVARGRGALLGAAVAAKLLPATALPGALSGVLAGGLDWRRTLRITVPAVAVVALAYVPYVLVSDGPVLGFLPGYLQEERYGEPGVGNRYLILRLLLPDAWAPFAAILILGLVALYVLVKGDPDRPMEGALLVSGALLLLFTPGYSWYALLVVALAAITGRWEWLGVALAGAVAYVAGPMSHTNPAIFFYLAAAMAVAVRRVVR
ncbi:hypothetical protein ACIBG8_08640 [Nonomuraea sp. NPDC050556]|uniref:hypothetical protein n=1 Tax=Nonomuraea sp. NPDC050556 TaxID=3364369 RepID=UPI0037BC3AF1